MHDNYQINHFIEVIFSQKKNIFQCYHKYHFIFIYITESTENEICCFEHIFGFYFLSCSLFVWNCIFKLCFSVILIHVNLLVLLVKNYPFGEVPFSKVNSIFYGWLSDCRKFGTLKVTKPCIYTYMVGVIVHFTHIVSFHLCSLFILWLMFLINILWGYESVKICLSMT